MTLLQMFLTGWAICLAFVAYCFVTAKPDPLEERETESIFETD